MNTQIKVTLSTMLLTSLSFMLTPPVQAESASSIIRSVLGNNTSYYDYNQGGYNSPASAAQSQTMLNLETKRAQLEEQISQAVSNGRMNGQQANALHYRLNSNANLQNSYANDGNLTFAEAQSLLSVLTDIDASVQSTISAYPSFANNHQHSEYFVAGHRQGHWGNTQQNTSYNIDRLQSEILQKLQEGRSDRQLSASEYNGFKREYDSIGNSEIQMRGDGQLSFRESNSLQDRLTDLSASISREMQNGNRWSGSTGNRNGYSWR